MPNKKCHSRAPLGLPRPRRWVHARPTQQLSQAPARERAAITNSARGNLQKSPSRGRVCSFLVGAENHKRIEIPARSRDKLGMYQRRSFCKYHSIAVARRGWVGRCVGGWGGLCLCVCGLVRSWLGVVDVFCSFPMVLSPLDPRALRGTNWIHIYCCTLLLYCCSTW